MTEPKWRQWGAARFLPRRMFPVCCGAHEWYLEQGQLADRHEQRVEFLGRGVCPMCLPDRFVDEAKGVNPGAGFDWRCRSCQGGEQLVRGLTPGEVMR